MAKQRKSSKNEESSSSKPVNSGAVVRHQKLCLSIDLVNRRLFGYTELEIVVPDIPIVGLHAHCLEIERVLVDGEPAVFEYYPHQYLENDKRSSPVSSPSSAADAAGAVYVSALERELVPNLLINCCKGFKIESEQQDQVISENGVQSSDEHKQGEVKQNVKLVRVDYLVEKAEAGIHFRENLLHTDNQIRRARCWFPCIDDSSQCCCYDLELTVAHNLVAVSSGSLLYQVLSKDDPPRKTYVYKVNVPVAAQWISLAVAPFKIHPDRHNLISHMSLLANFSKLRNTVEFFHSAFRHYEGYLSATFPFGSYTHVFIPPEIAVSSLTLGASMSIFSSKLLFDEKTIDQVIDTRIKLAYALARQWFGVYITPETPDDEWLLDGLSGFLTDTFIKQFLGSNEARYRRYKANCAVCTEDYSGATTLSTPASCKDLYGTQCIGIYGKIRSWKSVAILQMLEKQMGPDSFQKILQTIVSRARDATRPSQTLSTKEFRHLANKVGNLERPFLKEFFPRWVGSYGCPVLRMGLSYNKRKNMVELAVLRGCTAEPDSSPSVLNFLPETEHRDGDAGWPGMMSIRVHELDGMHDHPILPMAGDSWQLLEIQCHSKLAAKRFQKPKRSSKPDGSDEYGDIISSIDMRSSLESPLLWIRADPEMEYLAEIHFNQPVQMWINQLEKDRDVIAQSQAIATLEAIPQLSFSVVNALNNFLNDSKAFWRVRIEAAFALANTASEDTDWAGLVHLTKFFRSQRFDLDIGLPKPNDFRDFPEYFVLKAIPQAIAMVRVADKKSPREAVEFILQLLKYNDNSGNPYSDVFWLAALVQSVGDLEFGQQNILLLSSLLKRIDRLLQFDRLMPSHNGILTISCIQTLTRIALKLSGFVPLDRVIALVRPFRESKTIWQVRIEASKSLLNIELHCKGLDATLLLFIEYLEEEPSLHGQKKLSLHALRICQLQIGSGFSDDIKNSTLVALLHMLENRMAFNNVFLRHYLFCIVQVLAGRPPTLLKVPRDKTLHIDDVETCIEQKNIFEYLSKETKPQEQAADIISEAIPSECILDSTNLCPDGSLVNDAETCIEEKNILKLLGKGTEHQEQAVDIVTEAKTSGLILDLENLYPDGSAAAETLKEADNVSNSQSRRMPIVIPDGSTFAEAPKEAKNVSNSYGRRMPIVKIKVKQSAVASRGEVSDNRTVENSQGCRTETDRIPSNSFSADTPQRNFSEAVTANNRNHEEANSYQDRWSRMTASIGSVKVAGEGDDFVKELQCTADSSKVSTCLQNENPLSPNSNQDDNNDADAQKYVSLQTISAARHGLDNNLLAATIDSHLPRKERDKKKDKEKKRKRDDPEYLERKYLKKEKKRQKKQKEKEIAKLLGEQTKPSLEEFQSKEESGIRTAMVQPKPSETSGPKLVIKKPNSNRPEGPESTSAPKIRIKIKSRTLEKP